MPAIDAHTIPAPIHTQSPSLPDGARRRSRKTARNIRLADLATAQGWKARGTRLARKAPSVDVPGPAAPHDDAPVHAAGAAQPGIATAAVERSGEEDARQNESFGIDPAQLKSDLVAGTKRFLRHHGEADRRERAALHSGRYTSVAVSYRRDDGSIDKEDRVVRVEKTWAQRAQARSAQHGERVKRGYNHLSGLLRAKTGRPRKTGSGYGSLKGGGSLLAPATLLPVEQAAYSIGVERFVLGTTRNNVSDPQPGLVPALSATGDALALAGVAAVVVDALDAADDALDVSSRRAQDKADLLRCKNDALRFRRLLGKATAAEAQAYLDFDDAAARLIDPKVEDEARDAVTQAVAVKSLALQPVSSGVAVGAQVAGYAAPVSSAAVGMVAGPLSIIAGGIEVHQGVQDYRRRQAQIANANERKRVMVEVLEEFKDQSGAESRSGAFASLDRHQDRLIRQGKREKVYDIVRGVRGGVFIGSGAAGTALASVALAGVAGVTLATPAGAVLAVPALVGGAVLALRSYGQHRADHTSKWRERAADAAIRSMTRGALEQKLALPAGDPAAVLSVTLGEGEYLPAEDRFAGERTVEFDVRENEYVGLHIFALHLQDLVRSGDVKAAQPWTDALRGLGVDAVRLLAICKAASGRPAHLQLDFIKSCLAPSLGLTVRLNGQAIRHPSVFLGAFQSALIDAGIGKKAPPSASRYRVVRAELVRRFGKEGMPAFEASMREFLRKTGKQQASPLRLQLQAFLSLGAAGLPAADDGSTAPEIDASQVIELFRTTDDLFNDRTVRRELAGLGLGQPDEMAAAVQLGAAGLGPLEPAERDSILGRMQAFAGRLEAAA